MHTSHSPLPIKQVAIAIIVNAGRVLIAQRRATDAFANLWEFPGGKVEPGETAEQCLLRELTEELGVTVAIIAPLTPLEHVYPKFIVQLRPYLCTLEAGRPQPLASQQLRWVDPPALASFPFPPANETLIEEVIARLTQSEGTSRRERTAADTHNDDAKG